MRNKRMNENKNDETKRILIRKLTYELPILRARLGASQADIAQKIGISRQTYNSIETKKREMNWITFVALVAVFQNNQETNSMLNAIDGFGEKMAEVMSVQGRESSTMPVD